MVEELFKIFFEDAANISNHDVLCAAAERVGVTGAREALEGKSHLDLILREEKESKGIASGVPHFTIEIDGRKVEVQERVF